jgi:hypothetical protein
MSKLPTYASIKSVNLNDPLITSYLINIFASNQIKLKKKSSNSFALSVMCDTTNPLPLIYLQYLNLYRYRIFLINVKKYY